MHPYAAEHSRPLVSIMDSHCTIAQRRQRLIKDWSLIPGLSFSNIVPSLCSAFFWRINASFIVDWTAIKISGLQVTRFWRPNTPMLQRPDLSMDSHYSYVDWTAMIISGQSVQVDTTVEWSPAISMRYNGDIRPCLTCRIRASCTTIADTARRQAANDILQHRPSAASLVDLRHRLLALFHNQLLHPCYEIQQVRSPMSYRSTMTS